MRRSETPATDGCETMLLATKAAECIRVATIRLERVLWRSGKFRRARAYAALDKDEDGAKEE
jgi:hypothetical protein